MKKIVSLLLVIVMLLSATVVLSSCNKKGAEIKIYLGDQLYDLDPALAFVNDDLTRVLSLLYEPLFTLNEKGKVVNALAKSYKIIEDEERDLYQMEITLRETYWNDGRNQVTANDIFFAWTRILDPDFSTQAAPLLYDIKNAVAVKRGEISRSALGLEANRDVLTVTFEGKVDYDAFLRNLTSVALVPVRYSEVHADFWAQKASFISTNGPFSIRAWNKNTGEFTLQENRYFHSVEGEGSYVYPAILASMWTDMSFENYEDGNDRNMNKFLRKKLTQFVESAVFCVGSLPATKEERDSYAENVETYDTFSTYSYIFNTKKELFADEDVRRALSMVIDREYLAEQLVFAKAADGLISPAVWESTKKKVSFRSESEALIVTTAKLAEAQALLADKDLPTDEFELVVRNSPDDMFIASYAVKQWAKLGFSVSINPVSFDTEVWSDDGDGGREVKYGDAEKPTSMTVYDDGVQAMYMAGDFDVIGLDYQMYSTNAFTALCGFTSTMNGNGVENGFDEATGQSVRTPILHCSGFSDEAYDALIERAYKEKDLDKRAAILHEAEAYLMEKLPIMPIVYNQNYYIIEGVSGVDVDGYGNLVFTKAKASVVKEEAAKDESEK